MVPDDEMPYVYNPEEGFIISCNHKIVNPKQYKYNLGNMVRKKPISTKLLNSCFKVFKWKKSRKIERTHHRKNQIKRKIKCR